MNKEKEIEEMVDELSIELKEGMKDGSFWDFMYGVVEKMIVERGYRKADEVRKETAKEIADWLEFRYNHGDYFNFLLTIAQTIRKKYGVEVDE